MQATICLIAMNTGEKCLKTMSNPNYTNRHKEQKPSLGAHDSTLVFIVFFLIIIGFLAIFSAGAPKCIM